MYTATHKKLRVALVSCMRHVNKNINSCSKQRSGNFFQSYAKVCGTPKLFVLLRDLKVYILETEISSNY